MTTGPSVSHLRHLAGRFAGSLWPLGPPPAAEAWVSGLLRREEADLWRRMSAPDRRHGEGVARRVEATLPEAGGAVLVAALLHDVGKLEAGVGTFGRVAATVVGLTGLPRSRGWSGRRGWRSKVGRYLEHDRIGADLLGSAGSDPLVVAWARQHHWPSRRFELPAPVAAALKAADGD